MSLISGSLFWYIDEKARRRWDSLSRDQQDREIEKAKREELAWKKSPVGEWWCEKDGPVDALVTPIAAMQWWMKKLFGEILSSDELTAYCCAEHGMTIKEAQFARPWSHRAGDEQIYNPSLLVTVWPDTNLPRAKSMPPARSGFSVNNPYARRSETPT